jgi:hypothetical protein
MKPLLPLFVFVDACGWEIIRNDPFGRSVAPYRKRLETVFGYSSACVPSILSGRWPAEHRHWCFFVYDPEHSPFRLLRALRWLPGIITRRRRFRGWVSALVKARLNFRGYFDLYNIPFRYISLFDFTEKRSPPKPGMNHGANICDFLVAKQIAHFFRQPAKKRATERQSCWLQFPPNRSTSLSATGPIWMDCSIGSVTNHRKSRGSSGITTSGSGS